MKIIKRFDISVEEPEITICSNNENEIKRISIVLDSLKETMVCNDDKAMVKVFLNEILYFESVDKKTFVYTDKKIYTVNKRLYELEDEMTNSFVRCSKSAIINISKIKQFNRSFGARMEALMMNGERVIINRQYVKELKNKLEGGEK